MRTATKTGGRAATNGVIPGRIALSVGRPNLPEPEGFRWRPLSDMARMESGHTPSRTKPEYWGGEIPWIGIRDATGNHGRTIAKTLDAVTQAGLDNSSARLLPKDTVCLSRTASVGYVVQMARPMATSQDFVNWVCGPSLNAAYLRYALMLEQSAIRERFARGSTHQTMYYPEAKALNVLAPDRSTQDAIAKVVGALDDKIVANDRLVDLLDEICATEVRIGLRGQGKSVQLRDVLRLHYGRALPASSRRSGKVAVYGSSGVTGWHDEALVAAPGVVVGRKGSVGTVYWADGPHYPIDTAYYVESVGVIPAEVLYYVLRTLPLSSLNNDSAVPGLNRDEAYAQDALVPPSEVAADLAVKVRRRFHRASVARHESDVLAAMRDELLPLLMSGKVHIKDAEKVVEEVV